jgi:parallel beta-helix repeat protein
MRNNWYKKSLVVGIIVLFIGVSVVSSTATNVVVKKSTNLSNNGKTLYVGGSGEDNYTKIQDAVDNASDGDTIHVYSGTYYENIVININSISLLGEDKENTIIDGGGSGDVVYVSADWININKFTLRNSGDIGYPNYDSGIDLDSCRQCIVSDNIILNNKCGTNLGGQGGNNIINNTIKSNHVYGIKIYKSSNNIVTYNKIKYNSRGIDVYSDCWDNDIICNTINNNKIGIDLDVYSYRSYVYGNYIENNEWGGITMRGAKNILSYNNINNNLLGVYISYDSVDHEFYYNNFIGNKRIIDSKTGSQIFDNNYWNEPRDYPKLILGWREIKIWDFFWITIPKFMFDMHPASEPNELPCN